MRMRIALAMIGVQMSAASILASFPRRDNNVVMAYRNPDGLTEVERVKYQAVERGFEFRNIREPRLRDYHFDKVFHKPNKTWKPKKYIHE